MTNIESFILSYLANAAWQLPLLFAAGWVAARALRRFGAGGEHRVWVGVLLLEALLPAVSSFPWDLLRSLLVWAPTPINIEPHVSVAMGAGTAWTGAFLPAWLLATVATGYSLFTSYFSARFLWRLRKIHHLRRGATDLTLTGNPAQCWVQCEERFGIEGAALGTSSQVFGPVTIGIAHKMVLLPANIISSLAETEIRAAIGHEFAHMRRNDFAKNLAYELLSLPVSFHPFLSMTRMRITESREMVCDQMAAEFEERHDYARSLLRLASLLVEATPTRTPHAIGIFDTTTFERRIMRLAQKPIRLSLVQRFAVVTGSVLLCAGICASTLALGLHVDAMSAGDEHHSASPNQPVDVKPDVMQAHIEHKVPPVYPVDAKKARIQGTVKLDAVISKTGDVEQLKVISGPKELQQSSLDAVRQWTYKPFLSNGSAVDVRTTVNINYTLQK